MASFVEYLQVWSWFGVKQALHSAKVILFLTDRICSHLDYYKQLEAPGLQKEVVLKKLVVMT